MTENSRIKLSAPWTTFYRELSALFGSDPQIKLLFDEEAGCVKIYVDNADKCAALEEILPKKKVFGNVELHIIIVPANAGKTNSGWSTAWARAFEGNPAFSYIKTVEVLFNQYFHYVVFKKEVVQFFNDDLTDIHGMCSTLYEDIARDIFADARGVYFCTDVDSSSVSNQV